MEIVTFPPEVVTTPSVNSTPPACGKNEVFDECGNDCEHKFNEKEEICEVRVCFVGAGACACDEGFYRNKAGKCVTNDECEDDNVEIVTLPPGVASTLAVNSTSPTCGENEVFDECGNDCERKCKKEEKICKPRVCFVGAGACACGDGFYRNKSGKCVTEDECEDDNMEFDQKIHQSQNKVGALLTPQHVNSSARLGVYKHLFIDEEYKAFLRQ
ncbi:trypsin Inhibitor like cysteine rich domain protein [Ancylostoma caninum]|uniref:Trypsin Inhibitor like cysteine rich domain protein n=1 Tax=Ancylostoma caninum TaxID=29170 RepID=A0A368FJB2_ANCCA|nr:trypsin Inhibitor like cysteine rich domain protein [Ancylostoma caninum]